MMNNRNYVRFLFLQVVLLLNAYFLITNIIITSTVTTAFIITSRNSYCTSKPCQYIQHQPQQRSRVNTIISLQMSSSSSSSSDQQQQQGTNIENNIYGYNVHGTNSCFLPLQQLEQDTYMPRIIYIVKDGIYPSTDLTIQSIQNTPTTDPAPTLGQWTYTFPPTPSSTNGIDNMDDELYATMALPGSTLVHDCIDPIILIAEHTALNIRLPSTIIDPVDLIVLIDRSKTYFSERKFLVLCINNESEQEQQTIYIGAYHTRESIPSNAIILGHVEQVTIPWLPAMVPTKTGFLEADEYY